jgi:cell division protein FtsI/penicillin-binding protein 2
MLSAVSAVANHGVLMRPYIVGRIVDGGTVTSISPEVVRQAVSAETAAQVTEMLVYAVDTVLDTAAIPGYRVAGKSGTSEIPTLTGYDPEETIASFAGYVPADDPRFAILVVLERPQKEHFGLAAAAPAFREIGQRLLTLMAVPADGVRTAMQVR